MKKCYESPEAEELLVVSESVMQDSGEEIVDNEENDNTVTIYSLLTRYPIFSLKI